MLPSTWSLFVRALRKISTTKPAAALPQPDGSSLTPTAPATSTRTTRAVFDVDTSNEFVDERSPCTPVGRVVQITDAPSLGADILMPRTRSTLSGSLSAAPPNGCRGEPTLDELLSEPIIRALMDADGVDAAELEALLRRINATRATLQSA